MNHDIKTILILFLSITLLIAIYHQVYLPQYRAMRLADKEYKALQQEVRTLRYRDSLYKAMDTLKLKRL